MKNNKTLRLIFNSIIIPLRKIQLIRKLFPSFERFNTFSEWLKSIYEMMIRFSIVSVILSSFYLFSLEIYSNKYVLKNIEVSSEIPKQDSISFLKSNLNAKVILQMQEILDSTQNAQYSKINILNSIFEEAVPTQISGVDINQVFFFLKKILGVKNHEIRGFILKQGKKTFSDKNKIKLLLHIGDNHTENIVIDKDSVILFLAEKILMYHTPYELGMYFVQRIQTKDSSKILPVIAYMGELEREEMFFQNDRWREKRLHLLGLFHLNSKDKYREALITYDSLDKINHNNGAIQLERAKLYRNIIEKGTTDGEPIDRDSINILVKKIYDICKEVKNKKLVDWDNIGSSNNKKIDLMKSEAMIRQADALSVFNDINKEDFELHFEKVFNEKNIKSSDYNSVKILDDAFHIIMNDYHLNPTAEQWNLRAYIELKNDSLQNAEEFVNKAILMNNKKGNFYDTYAEILCSQSDRQEEFYTKLDLALKYRDIVKGITVEGYENDQRWEKKKLEGDFLRIMKKHEKDK